MPLSGAPSSREPMLAMALVVQVPTRGKPLASSFWLKAPGLTGSAAPAVVGLFEAGGPDIRVELSGFFLHPPTAATAATARTKARGFERAIIVILPWEALS